MEATSDCSHVLVFSNIPREMRSLSGLEEWICASCQGISGVSRDGVSVRWHDDSTAVAIFGNSRIAEDALAVLRQHPAVRCSVCTEKFKRVHEASASLRLPGPSRPITDARMANRLIRHALGPQRHVVGGVQPGQNNTTAPAAISQAAYLRPAPDVPDKHAGRWRRGDSMDDTGSGASSTAGGGGGGSGGGGGGGGSEEPKIRGRGSGTAQGTAFATGPTPSGGSGSSRGGGGGAGGRGGGGGGSGGHHDRHDRHSHSQYERQQERNPPRQQPQQERRVVAMSTSEDDWPALPAHAAPAPAPSAAAAAAAARSTLSAAAAPFQPSAAPASPATATATGGSGGGGSGGRPRDRDAGANAVLTALAGRMGRPRIN